KHRENEKQIAAILFGQAGMLDQDFEDDYPKELRKEYEFMQHKYSLHPIEKSMWKYMRMRPANFPTIRIAQLAACLSYNQNFFQKLLETENVNDLRKLFKVPIHKYWN